MTETIAAFAITADPVDFGAIDDQKVRLVFLLVGTEAAKSEHIKILSRISRLLNRDAFRERLLQARDAMEQAGPTLVDRNASIRTRLRGTRDSACIRGLERGVGAVAGACRNSRRRGYHG